MLLGTLASGWLHGKSANRWGQSDVLSRGGGKLKQGLPERLGPWRLATSHPPEQSVVDALQCVAYLHGVYVNDQTGDVVTVALVAGPGGPISVHAPEICYTASDYEIASERERVRVVDEQGQSHSFWQLYANSRHNDRPNLRVLFAWSDGNSWQAHRSPRFAFAGLPLLYKLQLAETTRDQAASSTDPCQDFLARFLAYLQPRLMTTSRLDSFSS